MGYPNSEWVKPFVHGKVVNTIEQNAAGEVRIRFDDGTALRMYAKVAQPITPSGEIITTPFGSDGEVMQSTRIIAGSERSVSSGHDFSHLPWWRKDRFGWPIETIKGRPVLSVLRIVCQNIRFVEWFKARKVSLSCQSSSPGRSR